MGWVSRYFNRCNKSDYCSILGLLEKHMQNRGIAKLYDYVFMTVNNQSLAEKNYDLFIVNYP